MTDSSELSAELQAQVNEAISKRIALHIRGGGTKDFYGLPCEADLALDVTGHRGIVAYEPTELVVTARAGTPLMEVEALLDQHDQQLPFEPPAFGEAATIAGVVASGLSGPQRPFAGAVRDAVLGVKIINGSGQILAFGGRVMKNVAGYDLSRLMAGAMGTLGLLLEVSIKVQPKPLGQLTVTHRANAARAIEWMTRWSRSSLAITGMCHDGERIYVRLCGGEHSLAAAHEMIGGVALESASQFWADLKELRLKFFGDDRPLWRLSVKPNTPPMRIAGDWLLDWGGALRWLKSEAEAEPIRKAALAAGGHATLFRGPKTEDVFSPLSPVLWRLHRNVKQALDPHGVFNPGRLYRGL